MIRIDEEEVKAVFGLRIFGSQGWLSNKGMPCPYCGKEKKWGVKIDVHGGVFHCWKCGTKASFKDFLEKVGRKDLIRMEYQNSISTKLTPLKDEKEENEEEELPVPKLPFRLKRILSDSYLDGRGFKKYHYDLFEPSETNSVLEKNLRNYIIFKMKMDGKLVGWLGRSRYSKEWHKKDLERAKETGAKPHLRYENSIGTNFTKILGGFDELSSSVKDVIIVEGLFDKVGIDNLLQLWDCNSLKCVFTFGNSISKEQISYLERKGIKNVILMYDDTTVEESKSAGLMLGKKFNTKIAYLYKPGIDPGDMDMDYLDDVLSNLYDPINFYVSKIKKLWL